MHVKIDSKHFLKLWKLNAIAITKKKAAVQSMEAYIMFVTKNNLFGKVEHKGLIGFFDVTWIVPSQTVY